MKNISLLNEVKIFKNKPRLFSLILVVIAGLAILSTLWFSSPSFHLPENRNDKVLTAMENDQIPPHTESMKKETKPEASVTEKKPPISQNTAITDIKEVTKNNLKTNALNETEDLKIQIEDTIAHFQDRVLSHTDATRVRVETKFLPEAGIEANQKLFGYVAFTTSAKGYHPEGVAQTMQKIASEYFTQFPDAPKVRVSLVVGGRVTGGKTFKPEDVN